MPHLDLTELEAKLCWMALCNADPLDGEILTRAFESLFDKAYRAYRGMPPQEAA